MDEQKQIFPHEIVEFSVEKHFQDYNPSGRKLYIVVLCIVFLVFIMMFIIKVDITVTSMGTISPIQGRSSIRTPINGIVDSLYVSENTFVRAGQPIMKIHTQALSEKGLQTISQRQVIWDEYVDLKNILAGHPDSLKTDLYRQQYVLYKQKLDDATNRLNLATKNFDRYSSLYHSRVISAEEYDKYDYDKKSVVSDLDLIKEQQLTQWQGDLSKLNQELAQMDATVLAPVSGFVQQLKGIQRGSFVTPNDDLGQISPDSGMIAEAFVFPKDIGLLRIGTPVRMQVDAFDYNVWGMLKGKVVGISNDIFTDGTQPYFKVRCQLDNPTLHLKNGYQGKVKNGMSLEARFVVTRRSLYQLLYDKTDDWLNPNIMKNEKNKS